MIIEMDGHGAKHIRQVALFSGMENACHRPAHPSAGEARQQEACRPFPAPLLRCVFSQHQGQIHALIQQAGGQAVDAPGDDLPLTGNDIRGRTRCGL